jgi:hypothetical protein
MKIYSSKHQAIVEAPIMEKPLISQVIIDKEPKTSKFYFEAYNKWLSTHKQVPDEFKDYWKDGQEVKEGIDYGLQHQVNPIAPNVE